jgi:hypothetical protein
MGYSLVRDKLCGVQFKLLFSLPNRYRFTLQSLLIWDTPTFPPSKKLRIYWWLVAAGSMLGRQCLVDRGLTSPF